MSHETALMRQAVQLAHENRLQGGRPFGAVLVRDNQVIATGINEIVQSHDPSTHAEMQAIRSATRALGSPSLAGCEIYASGHPCPMCLAALVMTGVEKVFFAFDNNDAAPYNLSSEGTYQRLRLSLNPPPLPIARVDTGITAAQLYGDAPWPQAQD
ncbi:MAG: nucleoside deaminase [Burkholderiaceae bacterium]|jgi:tRNA(Arg) A34 adenosine deaminase TadA|nr:nucleoside deaminase [Burkholderiaceae bacterium]